MVSTVLKVSMVRIVRKVYRVVDNDGDEGLDGGRVLSAFDDPLDGRVAFIVVQVDLVIAGLGVLQLLGPAHL